MYKKYKIMKEERHGSHPNVKHCMMRERQHNGEVASLYAKYLSKKIGLKKLKQYNNLSGAVMSQFFPTMYYQRFHGGTGNVHHSKNPSSYLKSSPKPDRQMFLMLSSKTLTNQLILLKIRL